VNYRELEILNPPIGKGSFTVVNKAYLRGTMVACKTYLDDYNMNILEDFKREVRNLIKLRHPNIVLFIGATNKPLCIITEFAARGSLYDVIHQSQDLNIELLKEILMDCCRGLAYLHSQDVLHRFFFYYFYFLFFYFLFKN
jgi:serine/threonine protein kinase